MDAKTIVVSVVSIAIACLMAVTLLIPIISESTTSEDTFTNEGMYYMTDADDNYTLVYDPTGKYIANGVDIPFTDIPSGERCTVVSTEEFMLRFANAGTAKYSLSLVNETEHSNVCDADDVVQTTFTFNNGTLTVSKNGTDTTYTYTSDSFRGITKTGSYVMTKANTPAKVNSDTTIIIGNGATQVTNWYDRFYITGTVNDMTVTPPDSITVSNIVVNSTQISGYNDLVELTSIQFTATDGVNTTNATYNRVIVPYEVTAERSIHPDASTTALLNIIPLFVVVGIILGTVGLISLRK